MLSANTKLKIQSFGRFLSNMVMPNIGAFIAWGFITALFIPTGWFPNETLGKLVGPMITYLLPLLIGYTGGKLVGGERGAVVGAITTAGVIASVAAACAVSFVVASFFVKLQKEEGADKLAAAQAASNAMKSGEMADHHGVADYQGMNTIFVACDAGMGSSAMGASMLRKKVNEAGLSIEVTNCAINNLPREARLVITHQDLTLRAKKQVPNAVHLSLTNFLDNTFYDRLVKNLSAQVAEKARITAPKEREMAGNDVTFRLTPEQIFLGLAANDKFEAIRFAGEQLVKASFVQPSYVDAMLEREKLVSTYLGRAWQCHMAL